MLRAARCVKRPPQRCRLLLGLPTLPAFVHSTATRAAVRSLASSNRKSTRGNEAVQRSIEQAKACEGLGDAVLQDQAEEPVPSQRVTLRPYQVECVTTVLDELAQGRHTRLGVSAPTGSGKTSIFTHLISLLPPLRHPTTNELATRVLILVNSIQLAHQTHAAISRAYPTWHIEIEQGTKHKASGLADATIATFQTLGRDGGKRLDKFETEYYKAVIVDEAHHSVSKTYLSILSRFDSQISESFSAKSATQDDPYGPSASPIAAAPTSSSTATEEVSPSQALFSESDKDLASLPSSMLDPIPMKLDDLGRPRVPLLAFSATWNRADGLALGKVFERIVWHAEWLDMIRSKWLSELKFTTLKVAPSQGMNLDNVELSSQTGDYVLGSLAREVDKEEINEIAVTSWFEKASDRRSTLVFAISISHILSLTNTFRKYGVDARFVYQETKPAEREEIYQAFRRGEFKVLVNCGILTEGADFPAIDCILLLRPTRSQTLFLQMLGRGLRLSPETGKRDCLVLDLVGSGTSAGGMVCTPTLFGIDPDADIEGESTSSLKALGEEQEQQRERQSAESAAISDEGQAVDSEPTEDLQIEYTEYETAFDYVSSSAADIDGEFEPDVESNARLHISRMTKLAWIDCGSETFVLELLGKGHVKIAKTPDGYTASLYMKLPPSPFNRLSQLSQSGPPSPYMTPRLLALHRSLPELLRSTDQYLRSKPEFHAIGLARNSPWRYKAASQGQLDFIVKKLGPSNSTSHPAENERMIEGIWLGKKMGTWVNVDELKKGQASDLISRMKHGGIAHVKKVKREYLKRQREADKVNRRKMKAEEKLVRHELREMGKQERQRVKEGEVGARLREELRVAEERRKQAKGGAV
ncbi:double-stranded DNA-dependent ATPase [Sporobolomyces koalae]|uniref:double-stranded DNA-dependent ATPase n=1 Tax=Sporobolomyces koalae TaxID=500713 RepID=UPI00317CD6B2